MDRGSSRHARPVSVGLSAHVGGCGQSTGCCYTSPGPRRNRRGGRQVIERPPVKGAVRNPQRHAGSVLRCPNATDRPHDSTVLSSRTFFRLHADDFKTGFRLEAGEPIPATDMSIGEARRHTNRLTSHSDPQTRGEPALTTTRLGFPTLKQVGGMSEYPAPTYPEPVMGGDLWYE